MMQRLFPLPLIGQGTPEVESFSSYLHRCAFEHGVYVGVLINFVYKEACKVGVTKKEDPELPPCFEISTITRWNSLSLMMVRCFEAATGQSLIDSTLNRLGVVLGQSKEILLRRFRWCPECFSEDKFLSRPPYFRLIWQLHTLTHCPKHLSPLVSGCSVCGFGQSSYRRTCALNICEKCGASLSLRDRGLTKKDVANSWDAQGNDILQLIIDLMKYPHLVFEADGIQKSLQNLLKYYRRKGQEKEFNALLHSDELTKIMNDKRPISLNIVRRLSYQLGMPIIALISGDAHQTTDLINSDWSTALPSDIDVARKRLRDHKKVLKKIYKTIADSEIPLSIREVARHADVSVGYLNYRHPALVKEIGDKYRNYRSEIQMRKKIRAQALALDFFTGSKYELQLKSRKRAYVVLRAETGLPKFMLKHAIQMAYQAVT